MTLQVLSINPWLYNDLGHSLIYMRAFEQATLLNGWKFNALLPKKCTLEDMPSHWEKKLDCPTVRHWFQAIEKRPYRRPRKVIRARQRVLYYRSLARFLVEHLVKNTAQETVLFLEAYAQTDIRLLVNLLRFFPKKKLSFWLMHRYQASTLKTDVKRYQKDHQSLIKMGINLKLFTDSDLLKEDLEACFELPFTVLPIHYIEPIHSNPPSSSKTVCWWPGLIREGKGLKIIQEFACSQSDQNAQIQLVVNENSALSLNPNSPKVTFLKDHLSREDYLAWMKKSDVILLPYVDPHYQKATSSIFIEAILASKIPLVFKGTWMAYELEKEGLEELIVDWNATGLSGVILEIVSNPLIKSKLNQLKKKIKHFHSLQNYSQILKKISLE